MAARRAADGSEDRPGHAHHAATSAPSPRDTTAPLPAESLADAVAALQDGLCILDQAGTHKYVDPAFCRLTGFTEKELLATEPPHPYWHPDDYRTISEALSRAFEGQSRCLDLRFIHKDGSPWSALVSPSVLRDQAGNVRWCVATVKDVTQHSGAKALEPDSLERYILAAEAANDGVWDWDISSDSIYTSPRWKAMLGYAEGELEDTFQMWASLLHPDDRQRVRTGLSALKSGETSEIRAEYRVRHKDGSYRWILDRARGVRDARGHPYRVVGSHTDITGHKKAEEALAHAAEQWRHTFDAVPDLVIIIDREHRIVHANRAMAERVGRSPEELVGTTCHESMHGLPYVPDFCPHARLLHSETEEREEVPEPYLDGVFDVTTTPLRDPSGTLIGSVHVARDITQRKRAEDALSESEQRYQAFINATDDLVFIKDDRLRYVTVNPANIAFFGTSLEEIIGRTDADLMPPEGAESCRRSDQLALQSGQTVVSEELVGDRVYEVRKFSVPLPGGRTGVGGYARDITDRRRAEEDLAAGAERLRTALHDTVRSMGAVVALRDPYTGDHEQRVTLLADAIAASMGLQEARREGLHLAGQVHDIGKIGVPAEILAKPAQLTAMEYELIKQHPARGADLLAQIAFEQPVAEIVHQHHERLDGSGYPQGLAGNEIMLEARILAVADVVEAMASHRPYRAALGIETALAEVRRGAGTLYDPEVVATCERVVADGFRFPD